MANPFQLALGGGAATAAGGIVSAIGALGQGASQQAMYNYQAGVAQLNQKIALQNQTYALDAGDSAAYVSGLKTRATVSGQTVAQADSGIDVNSGSAVQVRNSTIALGQYDEGLIRKNAAKTAYGYSVEASLKGTEAQADTIAGTEAGKAATLTAASSILGAAGSVSSKWLQGESIFGKAA